MRTFLMVLVVVSVTLVGCAKEPKFVHLAGVSDLQFDKDVMECNLIAHGIAVPGAPPPPAAQPSTPGQQGFGSGFTQGFQSSVYQYQVAQMVKARKQREHAKITCMRLRGYEVE